MKKIIVRAGNYIVLTNNRLCIVERVEKTKYRHDIHCSEMGWCKGSESLDGKRIICDSRPSWGSICPPYSSVVRRANKKEKKLLRRHRELINMGRTSKAVFCQTFIFGFYGEILLRKDSSNQTYKDVMDFFGLTYTEYQSLFCSGGFKRYSEAKLYHDAKIIDVLDNLHHYLIYKRKELGFRGRNLWNRTTQIQYRIDQLKLMNNRRKTHLL